ncbi:MAG: DUF1007 family protein [Pseudomonadota bacterium]
MFRRVLGWLGLAGAAGLIAGNAEPAQAHPHVWVDHVTTFVFEDRQLVALRHRWAFDAFFGSFVIEEHDVDRNGAFDVEEMAALRAAAFANLDEYSYFTQLRVDGELQQLHNVAAFEASIDDGVLVYDFTLRLPAGIDPTATDFSVGVYDPEYYVELMPEEDHPVRFAGLTNGACTFDMTEDTEHPIYYGMVDPPIVTLACATS